MRKEASFANFRCAPVWLRREELEKIWKDVLLYQFHDVLPGSAIAMVYEVTTPRWGSRAPAPVLPPPYTPECI